MRRSVIVAFTGALALVAGAAAPAWAHQEISPATVPTGKPLFLTLTSANEKKVDLTKLTLTAPAGADLGEATKDPAGWTSSRSGSAITWTGGAVKPGRFEYWGFEVEGFDQAVPPFKVMLGYADGTSEDAEVQVQVGGHGDSVKSGGDTDALSTVAIVVALVALVGSAAALAFARSGRAKPAGATEGQDW